MSNTFYVHNNYQSTGVNENKQAFDKEDKVMFCYPISDLSWEEKM